MSNVGLVLTELHAAAPQAGIVELGIDNPYPAVLPAPGGDPLVGELNTALAHVAASLGAGFANPDPVFNPAGSGGQPETGDIPTVCLLTAMCPGGTHDPASPAADIHPTTLGYGVLAGLIGLAHLHL